MVTTQSHFTPGTQSWVLASWCSIMPGPAARVRRLRCLPRPGAFCTTPASCSRFLTQVTPSSPRRVGTKLERLDVPARMSSTVALHQRHDLIPLTPAGARPAPGACRSTRADPRPRSSQHSAKRSARIPRAAGSLPPVSGGLLATPIRLFKSHLPNLLQQVRSAHLDTSSASNETGHITGYKSGQFICSLHRKTWRIARIESAML